jgi:hypothetical protein
MASNYFEAVVCSLYISRKDWIRICSIFQIQSYLIRDLYFPRIWLLNHLSVADIPKLTIAPTVARRTVFTISPLLMPGVMLRSVPPIVPCKVPLCPLWLLIFYSSLTDRSDYTTCYCQVSGHCN